MKRTGFLTQHASHPTRRSSQPRGQGLVELVLVIPTLIIIVVGALDLGRAFFSVITVTNVAREGVRYLTLHPEDRLTITENAQCYDLDAGMQPDPTYKPPYFCTTEAAKQETLVTLGAPIVIDPDQITITASCVNVVSGDFGCDRGTEAYVTASYVFQPITLQMLPVLSGIPPIVRTARMMVP